MRVILALAAFALPVMADGESYAIKIKVDADTGRTVTFRSSGSGTTTARDSKGNLVSEEKGSQDEVFRTTVFRRDESGRPTKFLRVFEKMTRSAAGKSVPLALEGHAVLYERIDGKLRIGLVGEKGLDRESVMDLFKTAERLSETDALLRHLSPGKPVKVGDSGSVAVKPVADTDESQTLDLKRSSISAKLARVYDKGGRKWGTIEVTRKFVCTQLRVPGGKTTYEPAAIDSQLTILDISIDGSTVDRKESRTQSFRGTSDQGRPGVKRQVTVSVDTKNDLEVSTAAEGDKPAKIPQAKFLPDPWEWTEFKTKDGTFVALFPGPPLEKTNKMRVGTETQYAGVSKDQRVVYAISVVEPHKDSAVDAEDLMLFALRTLPNGTSKRKIEVNGHAGFEFVIAKESDGIKFEITRRLIVADNMLIDARVSAEDLSKPETEKFFKSLQILAKSKKKND